MTEDAEPLPLWRKLAWMALIWLASVSALGIVAYILRIWIKA